MHIENCARRLITDNTELIRDRTERAYIPKPGSEELDDNGLLDSFNTFEGRSYAFNAIHEVSPVIHPCRFQALITLFPEYFSSFAQATCSLSEFAAYLVLSGTHLTFPASFPKYRTHCFEHGTSLPKTDTGLSPTLVLHSRRITVKELN